MICETPFFAKHILILQNIDDVVDIIDGVVVDDDQWSRPMK